MCTYKNWRNICVTDRRLADGDLVGRIAELLKIDRPKQQRCASIIGSDGCPKPDALILREKDLSDDEYRKLAIRIQPLCQAAGVAFLINGRMELIKGWERPSGRESAESAVDPGTEKRLHPNDDTAEAESFLAADGIQLSFAAAKARYEENLQNAEMTVTAGSATSTAAQTDTKNEDCTAVKAAAPKDNDGCGGNDIPFGVSVHSPEEAVEAEKFGASWLVYGHVFETDCKKGLDRKSVV